jgi:DNA-cytosine methyltransferase
MKINVVDLFCGCGGLACGFELHKGRLQFRTVLGIDNHAAAIRTFNANFIAHCDASLKFQIGRLADITWFTHPAEIRLFYLLHYALTQGDIDLEAALRQLGTIDFLTQVQHCDDRFECELLRMGALREYRDAVALIPQQTFSLALTQSVLGALALCSITRPALDKDQLPWCEEYKALLAESMSVGPATIDPDPKLTADFEKFFRTKISKLTEAASKTGFGQNRHNAHRLKALIRFLESDVARQLCDLLILWQSERATIRADFCLSREDAINALYTARRRVHVVLGGPPCKGFSRIGRPVIAALRDQGVHAWSHYEYGDERNALMCQYVLFLRALKPDMFLFENVSNFQSKLKTPNGFLDAPAVLEDLIAQLSDGQVGYSVRYGLFNAREFAVPQDRHRFIMVGVSSEKAEKASCLEFFSLPTAPCEDVPLATALLGLDKPRVFATEDGVNTDYVSPVYRFFDERLPSATRKYLAWIHQVNPLTGKSPLETTAHIYRLPRADDRAFVEFVGPGIRWMDLKLRRSPTLTLLKEVLLEMSSKELPSSLANRIKELLKKADENLMLRLLLEHTQDKYKLPEQHLLLEGYLKNGGSTHGDWLERLSATRPCKTIMAHIGKDTYGYWHPSEGRALTIREAARVQSFPDFFKFGAAGVVDTYAMIGNAVPPLLSAEFAHRIESIDCSWKIFDDAVRLKSAPPHVRVEEVQASMFPAE